MMAGEAAPLPFLCLEGSAKRCGRRMHERDQQERIPAVYWNVVVLIFTAVIPIVRQQQESERDKGIFRILVSSENEDAAAILQDFAGKEKIDVEFDTASTMDMMDTLNSESCQYDAAWLSNSIWVYMLDGTQAVTNAKATFISPVVFGVVKSKAQELGFVDTPVYMADIVSKVESGDLTFLMPSATQTNSGASAYLAF